MSISSQYTLIKSANKRPPSRSPLLWFLNTLITTLIVLYVSGFAVAALFALSLDSWSAQSAQLGDADSTIVFRL